MRFAPEPTEPEMPGEKWHKETYEESLKAKPKVKPTVVVPDDHTTDDSGWMPEDESGYVN